MAGVMCWTLLSTLAMYHAHAASTTTTTSSTSSSSSRSSTHSVLRHSSSSPAYTGPTSSTPLSLRTSTSYIVSSGSTPSSPLSPRTSSSSSASSGPAPSTRLSLRTSSSSSAFSGLTPSNFPNLRTPSSYIVPSGPAPSSPPNLSSAYRAQAEKRRGRRRRRRRSSAYSNSPNTITSPSSSVYTDLTPTSPTNLITSPSNTAPSDTTRSNSSNQRPPTSNNALSGTKPPTPPNLKPSSSSSTTPPWKPRSSGRETEGPGAAGGSSCSLAIPAQALRVGLGCVGGLLNTVAMYCVWKNGELTGPFRAVLASLTLSGQAMAVVCVLLAVCSLAQTYSYPGWVTGTRRQKDWEPSSLSVVCSVGISLYHSLLGCGATTTLALSIDRVLAVFLPVRYRVLGRKGSRMFMNILPPWMLALVSVVALPLIWHFHGDGENVELSNMTCWPLVAAHIHVLTLQAVVLLVSAVGVTVTHMVTLHKLSRRAILVVPFFGPRTADSTSGERGQTRRSAAHAVLQALVFCSLYLPFAGYLMVLGTATGHRPQEACSVRFVSMSLFPVVNAIVNPLVTLARLVTKGAGAGESSYTERATAAATSPVCGGDRPKTHGDLFIVTPDMTSHSPKREGGDGKGKGIGEMQVSEIEAEAGVTDEVKAMKAQAQAVNTQNKTVNVETKMVNAGTETINAETKTVNVKTKTVKDKTKTVNTETKAVKTQAKDVKDQAEAETDAEAKAGVEGEGEGEGEDKGEGQADSRPSCSYFHRGSGSSGSGAWRRTDQWSENDSSAA